MRHALLFLFIGFFASVAVAQNVEEKKKPEEKEKKIIHGLNVNTMDLEIRTQDALVQEQISVEAPEYPGLNIDIDNPVELLRAYKPFTKQELQAYSDLLTDFHLLDYDRSETARPHKPARLIRTTIPLDQD